MLFYPLVRRRPRPFAHTTRLGSAPDVEDVSGNITIPEIAHDTEIDEYVVRHNPLDLSDPLRSVKVQGPNKSKRPDTVIQV